MRAPVVVQEQDQGIVEYALALEGVHNPADCHIHGLELPELLGVIQVGVGFDVLVRRVIRVVYGIERQVEKKRTTAVVALAQRDRLVGQEKGRIAGLDHWTPVSMPIQNAASISPE